MAARKESPIHYPYAVDVGQKRNAGLHSQVYALGEDWVLKETRSMWQKGNWEKDLQHDLTLLKAYLGEFIPTTGLVMYRDPKTLERKLSTVQKNAHADRLQDWTWEEILGYDTVRNNLIRFADAVDDMYQETRRIPDIHGGGFADRHQYDFKQAKCFGTA